METVKEVEIIIDNYYYLLMQKQLIEAKQELEDAEANVVQKRNHVFLLIAEIEELKEKLKSEIN